MCYLEAFQGAPATAEKQFGVSTVHAAYPLKMTLLLTKPESNGSFSAEAIARPSASARYMGFYMDVGSEVLCSLCSIPSSHHPTLFTCPLIRSSCRSSLLLKEERTDAKSKKNNNANTKNKKNKNKDTTKNRTRARRTTTQT